jgi:hypothetical protein
MVERDGWVFFKNIDWDCPKNNRFNIDTRDFCCGYRWTDDEHEDFSILVKNRYKFFHTKDELISLLERLFEESGGEGEWRMLSLGEGSDNWSLKYLRVQRYEQGFLVCSSNERALNKEFLRQSVNQKYLCHIKYEDDLRLN